MEAKIVSVTRLPVLGNATISRPLPSGYHTMGAYMVVDAAQSAPHILFRRTTWTAIWLSAHKMCGPWALRFGGRSDASRHSLPAAMIDSVTETSAVWAPVPEKFEVGTQDAAGIYATGVAVEYLNGLDMAKIEKREEIARYLRSNCGRWTLLTLLGSKLGQNHVGCRRLTCAAFIQPSTSREHPG